VLQDEPDLVERRAVVGHVRHDRTVPKIIDWQRLLVDGYEPMKKAQKLFRRLPSEPRCKLCKNPFGGVAGRVLSHMGRRPSRKNPNLCQYCFDHLPPGGLELDIGVVFADVRGSTALGERSTATEFAEKLNRFYATATDVLVSHDGIIDKLIGDEVMALFIPGLAGADYRTKAARAAIELAGAVLDLPVGIAAHAGVAFVGNVGAGTVLDFTALGDAVNTASRLQSEASPGEVVLLSDLYDLVESDHPGASRKRVDVRGRDTPVDIAVLACGRFSA
jgi:adenylate cyclase